MAMSGYELRLWRDRHGWTQVELGARMGYSRRNIIRLEQRRRLQAHVESLVRSLEVAAAVEAAGAAGDDDGEQPERG